VAIGVIGGVVLVLFVLSVGSIACAPKDNPPSQASPNPGTMAQFDWSGVRIAKRA
jgi:hypothetical protein